jgi:hypothetical protein
MSDEIDVIDEAAGNTPAAWESRLDALLKYIEPFEDYINGGFPAELCSEAKNKPFALSYSSISKLVDNPLRFYEYVVNSKFLGRKEPTKAMLIGQIADDYILSRLIAGEQQAYVPMLGTHKRNTKVGKASFADEEASLKEAYPDATIVDRATYELAQNVVNSLVGEYQYQGIRHYVRQQAYELLQTYALASKVRFKYTCPKFGLTVVGEVDLYGKDAHGEWYAADLKSMAAVDNKAFYYSVRDRLLYLQAYIYKVALKQVFGIDIQSYYVIAGCVDGHSNIYRLTSRDFDKGKQDYEQGLSTFANCQLLGAPAFVSSYDINKYEF